MSRHNEYDDGEDEKENEEELSSGESDDAFDEDMEALKRACMITGANPNDLEDEDEDNDNNNASKSTSVSSDRGCGGGGAALDLESEDDLELLRSIRSRFSLSEDALEPLSMKPLCTLPLVISADDDEDDFETLRAIQRRFSAYDGSDTPRNYEKVLLQKPEQVHASGIASENGTSNEMFMNRTNACEGLPDSEQACDNIPDSLAAIIPDSEEACNLVHLLSENVTVPSAGVIEWDQSGACKSITLSFRYSSFPESARVFIDAIKRNRSYQRFLRSKLIQIEARIEENKKLKERVKILKDFQVSCKKITGRALSQKKDPRVQLISARKSGASDDKEVNDKKVSAMHCGPTENSHVARYGMALTKFPLSLDWKKWSREEKENLAKGIRQQIQEMLLQVSADRFSGLEGSPEDTNNLDNILVSIKDLEITPELIRQFLPKVNWNKLASMYVVGRSGAECETCMCPSMKLALQMSMTIPSQTHLPLLEFIKIARLTQVIQVGPYMMCTLLKTVVLNASVMIVITDVCDALSFFIIQMTVIHRLELLLFHSFVLMHVVNPYRWLNLEDPLVNRNPWTAKEDNNLLSIIEKKGITKWLDIAVSLGTNRTPFQCLERYQRSLNACILRREWTKDEDDQLHMAVGTFGDHQREPGVLKLFFELYIHHLP